MKQTRETKQKPVYIPREPGFLNESTSFGLFHYCSTSIFFRAPGSISSIEDAEACSNAFLY